MKVSIFSLLLFFFVCFEFIFPLYVVKRDFAKEWVKDKLSIVNLKLDKYDKKKKMALISGASYRSLSINITYRRGIYLTSSNKKCKVGIHRGVKLDNAVPTEETFKKYYKQNIKDEIKFIMATRTGIISLIPYIRFNVERLAIFP
ncbi:early transcribed membrane protein 8, putative [Plasmodium sp. gorilla clade G2]|uniref:early transcribed membrane protein 8, putative n=1 Tax=Plasmodium sp. gorilla clade G2 TaxID=880535 RepID=UPI000D21B870|nr:early transcribed membrane protein 8, putative [Plasmodium sp. gorilla clade G2]SOV13842.1 early transcribed membrane protein 8, putative [Plasmodium sp. gorilla clade G2]